ncbi:hypothetical protein ANANG_G00257890 [Anguilla anguilla]|uniref:Uncharacterized protein n=1 Tax=Anguilla anguilla TaxID=7936 RepID=A0A9D3LR93_ANGAN|nr:hypothetical protein ANANG_G00257890 [Anguilla anguilla]
MNDPPGGSKAHRNRDRQTPERTDDYCGDNSCDLRHFGIKNSPVFVLSPSDPVRQAKRLPLRILRMLTAHSSHMLHPEYLQPLTSAPVSIELDAKKSPLALLAQTCSQIGKPDPLPPPSWGRAAWQTRRPRRAPPDPPSNSGSPAHPWRTSPASSLIPKWAGTVGRKGAGPAAAQTNRVSGWPGRAPCQSFPRTPSLRTPKRGRRPCTPSPPHPAPAGPALHTDPKPGAPDPAGSDSGGGGSKKEAESCKPSPDGAQAANSAHARASANASSGSSAASPARGQGRRPAPSPATWPRVPLQTEPRPLPLPPRAWATTAPSWGRTPGYPSPFVSGLDHAKASLVGGVGVPEAPQLQPADGASPPSFMQGLCRDPYCLAYPSAPTWGQRLLLLRPRPLLPLKSGFPWCTPPTHCTRSTRAPCRPGCPQLSHPSTASCCPTSPSPTPATGSPLGAVRQALWLLRGAAGSPPHAHRAPRHGRGQAPLRLPLPATSCHLHLLPGEPCPLASSFSLRAPPSLSLARYHPYGKMHLPAAPSLPIPSLPTSSHFYSPYALYGQRLGSASALGYP